MTTKRYNYRSDLEHFETFYQRAQDGTLSKISIPEDGIDFTITYRAEDDRTFLAYRKGGRYVGCQKYDDSTLRVFIPLSQRSLGRGELIRELRIIVPDDNFPNQTRNICIPAKTGCYLWNGPSDGDSLTTQGQAIVATMIDSVYQAARIGGYRGTRAEFYATLGNLGRSPQESYVPQSRAQAHQDGTIDLDPISPAPQEARYFIGVQSRVRGAFRLIQQPVTGMQQRNVDLSSYLAGIGFQPLQEATRGQDGILTGKINVLKLLDSEFIPLSALSQQGLVVEAENNSMNRCFEMRFFCRGRFIRVKNDPAVSPRYTRSLHNPIFIKVSNPDRGFYGRIGIDRTTKGNKQVVRRIYKVGFVRPKSFLEDGITPNWGAGYFASNWHDVLVERVIYPYAMDETKDYAVVKVI